MLIPPQTFQQLSPIAAKLFLFLLPIARRARNQPFQASLEALAAPCGISIRACRRAMAELHTLQLISPLPRKYHQPNAYFLITQRPDQAPVSNAPAPTGNPVNPNAPEKPNFQAENPIGPDQAPLLNQKTKGPDQAPLLNTHDTPAQPGPYDPDSPLARAFASLTSAQREDLVRRAREALARLNA